MPKLSFAGLHVAQRAPMAAWKAALLRVAAVLLALGLGFYALGTAVFSRRDLPL